MLPSSGDAWIGQKHILTEQKSVRRLIGYCPQHDALLDLLTVRDHLLLFGRLKGVSKQRLPGLVQKLLETLTLEPHEHKLAHTLSGGNKRKLSVAIALIGSPPLIFLDEPSTGVDPAARRFMWSVIANISTMRKECSVILTTHVMEEAEALCGRIGIMVGGRFRCLGSGQHLKGRFGQGYQLEFKLATPTAAQIEELHVKHFRVGTQGLSIPAPQIEAVCAAMGDQDRYRDISEEGDGHIVYHALQAHSEGCPAEVLMEWWLVGQAVAKAQVRCFSCRANCRLLSVHGLLCRPSSTKTSASPCCSSATTWRSATASPAKRRSPRCSARSRRRRCRWAWRSMACARCAPPAGPRAAYFLACSAVGAGCADLAGANLQRLCGPTGRGDGRGALNRDPPLVVFCS